MSRYDVEKFDPPPDPELICCICQCVLDNAKESPCRHVFCKVCIEQWLSDHSSCPTCRTWLSKPDLQNVLPLVQNMINRLAMYCDNRSNGCEDKLILEMYDSHIQMCPFRWSTCTSAGCNVRLLHKDLVQHLKDACKFREVTCKKGCQLKVPLCDLSFHNCMIALKQKSEKQQNVIFEYWKRIKDLVSLKDMLKGRVDNLLRNTDRTTFRHDENTPLNVGLSSSVNEEEDDIPPNIVLRGSGDIVDGRLSEISNFVDTYSQAVDFISSEMNLSNSETGVIGTPQNDGNRQDRGRHSRDENVNNQNRYTETGSQTTRWELESNIHAEPLSTSNPAGTVGATTGTDDNYNSSDFEEFDLPDSEDGNNSADEYNSDNIDDNSLFESNDDNDYDDISSIHSSLLAEVHSESADDETEHPNDSMNNLLNLYEEVSAAEVWPEPGNVNQSTEETVESPHTPHAENDFVPVEEDDNQYFQRSDENYLSSNYISSPSVTSVQYSPIIMSSPLPDSESELYENNATYAVSIGDLDENPVIDQSNDWDESIGSEENENHVIDQTIDWDESVCSDDDDDDDDDNADDDTDLAMSDDPSSPTNDASEEEANQNNDGQPVVCVLESSNSAHLIESETSNNTQIEEQNESDIDRLNTQDNKPFANNSNAPVERFERSRLSRLQVSPDPSSFTPIPKSLCFKRHAYSRDNHRLASTVSIKIEPCENIDSDIQKTVMSTQLSYNSRMTQGSQPVNPAGTEDVKPLSRRLTQTDNSNHNTSSSERISSKRRCTKRSSLLPIETRPVTKQRRTRDHSDYNLSSSPSISTVAQYNRVDPSVINISDEYLSLPAKLHGHRLSVPNAGVMSPAISSSYTLSGLHYWLPLNSPVPSSSTTGQIQRQSLSTREQQHVDTVQSDAHDIRVVEERTLSSSGMEGAAGGGRNQTFQSLRHSLRSECTVEQQPVDSDDEASYEPSDSYSSDDTDGEESNSSYEALVPKSISQLLDEYDSDDTDKSWTFDMA